MALAYFAPNRITGLQADRTGGTWTNLPAAYFFFETDTLKTYYWNGTTWSEQVVTGAGGGGAPDISRVIYVASDGTGDYTTLAAALSAQGANKNYKLSPGTHTVTSQLVSSLSNIWIDGYGPGNTRLQIDNGVGTTNAGIKFEGSLGAQKLLTVNAPRESHTLTFATGHGFVADDWLILRRNVQVQSSGNAGQDAEIHKVKSVTSTVVTLSDYIYEDYNTATLSAAYKINFASNITLTNLTIYDNRTSANQTAVTEGADCLFLYCYNLLVSNVVFERMFYCSAGVQSCYNVTFENVGFESPQFLNVNTSGTYWVNYGLDILNATTNMTVNGGWANRCRHSITTDIIGGDTFTYGRQRNITINGMVSYNSNTSHYDSHEGCVGLTFNGCVALGGYHQLVTDYGAAAQGSGATQQTDQVKGFTARSPTIFSGCIASNCEQYAFEVAGDDPYAAGTDLVPGGDGTAIVNCQIIQTQGGDATSSGGGGIRRGIRINSHRKGIRITGNFFKSIGGICIWLNENTQGGHQPPTSIIISGNNFISCGADLSSSFGLIYGDDRANDILISNNVFGAGTPPASAYPVRIVNQVQRMVFSGNDVNGLTNIRPQIGATSTNIKIENNLGLNPMGVITNPVNTTNFTIGSYGGTTGTVTASQDYTIVGAGVILVVTGGTGVSMTIKDAAGTTVDGSISSPVQRTIPQGYKINFGAFSGAPTIVCASY